MKQKLYFLLTILFTQFICLGQTGNALNFDGTNDQINLGNSLSAEIDPLNTITVEALVYPTSLTSYNGCIIGNYAYPTDNGQLQFLLRRDGNAYNFIINDGSGLKNVSAPGSVSLNTWTHVAGVWDGSTLKIYINGILQGTTTNVTGSSFVTLSNSFAVGFSYAGAPDEAFTGSIDEIRIWSTARTQTQIDSYKATELALPQTGLLRYYKFNQGVAGGTNSSVTSLTDSSGNSNNGTLTNFTLNGSTSNWIGNSPLTPATHLNFDGSNDFISCGTTNLPTGTSARTIEAWIKTSQTSGGQSIVNYGNQTIGNSRFGFLNVNGNLYFVGEGNDYNTNTLIADGNWHHIAATYEASTLKIYIDGVLNATVTKVLNTNNNIFNIGASCNPSPGENFQGSIDEVRIWNYARTIGQINGSKNCELQGNETGLVSYYNFNQGIDAANNTAITSLPDLTSNANNGTLNNFTLTGSTSNWLAGSPIASGSIVPSNATVTTPVTYNQGATATALTATTGANGTGLVWYTTATGGTGTTTAPTPSTATAGSTSYWVSSTNANGCESARTEIVVTVLIPATHLNFDGVNDYVQIPKTFNSDFTIEFWVKTTSTSSTGPQWYFGKSIVDNEVGGVTSDFGTALVGSKLAFGIGSPDVTIFSTSNINDGNWNHIAVSWKQSSGEMKLYVNGINESSGTGSTNQRTASNFIKLATNNYLGNYFNGDIDEVRIWNRALPIAEIQNNMNCELPSPSTQNGLVAYYQFNQGVNEATNTSVTSLTDTSGNANNGTLTNFALTGTTSNWLAGSPIVTGTNCAVLSTSNFEIANNIKMYPNPTSNFVTVEVNNLTNAKLQVLDITGKTLMNQALNTSSNNVDVQHLPSGMYLFKVSSNEGTSTGKIIKN